jgi:hypothetical protein
MFSQTSSNTSFSGNSSTVNQISRRQGILHALTIAVKKFWERGFFFEPMFLGVVTFIILTFVCAYAGVFRGLELRDSRTIAVIHATEMKTLQTKINFCSNSTADDRKYYETYIEAMKKEKQRFVNERNNTDDTLSGIFRLITSAWSSGLETMNQALQNLNNTRIQELNKKIAAGDVLIENAQKMIGNMSEHGCVNLTQYIQDFVCGYVLSYNYNALPCETLSPEFQEFLDAQIKEHGLRKDFMFCQKLWDDHIPNYVEDVKNYHYDYVALGGKKVCRYDML